MNYTKSTNFATKDSLPSGNPLKIVRGTEIDTEFNNIATAITSKSDSISPTFSGTVTTAALTVNGTATFNGATALSGFTSSTAIINIGSGQIYKDVAGNVGIGRAPNYTLDVYRPGVSNPTIASANDNIVTIMQSVGATQANIGTITSHPLAILAGNVERLRLTTDNRFQADFSNATIASRAIFQTSTTNGNTTLTAIPNGTSTTANFVATNNSDPTNSAIVSVGAIGTTDVRITSGIFGTGTYLPMTFYVGGAERLRARTDGSLWTDANTQPGFFARAWVNFNGQGTVAIRSSGNVSSITDNGVGNYTVNMTTAMPDTSYAPMVSATLLGGNVSFVTINTNLGATVRVAPTTSSFVVAIIAGAVNYDSEDISVCVLR